MTDAGLSHKPKTPKLSALLCFLVGNSEQLYILLYIEKLTLCGCACVHIHVWMCIHAMAWIWKPEDKWKELVLSCTFWGQNLGLQAWWQIPLPTKQSHWPSPTVCVRINGLSENYQIVYRSWYPPEMEGVTLLLNMPLVLVAGHKEIELELSWE